MKKQIFTTLFAAFGVFYFVIFSSKQHRETINSTVEYKDQTIVKVKHDFINSTSYTEQSQSERQVQLVHAIRTSLIKKNNIFYDLKKHIKDLLEEDKDLVNTILDYLLDNSEIENLKIQESIIKEKPAVVLERMAAIDMLAELIAQNDDSSNKRKALESIASLVHENIDPNYSNVTKQIILAEQFDLVGVLTQSDTKEALKLIGRIKNPKHYELLERAAINSLIHLGKTDEEAVKLVNELKQDI